MIDIRFLSTPCKQDPQIVDRALEILITKGFKPLILGSKREFYNVFGITKFDTYHFDRGELERYYLFNASRAVRERDIRLPIAGDIFYSRNGSGLYYVLLFGENIDAIRKRAKDTQTEVTLEMGFIGEALDETEFAQFGEAINDSLEQLEITSNWNSKYPLSQQFIDLFQSEDTKFTLASDLPEIDIEVSEKLEDISTRNIAVIIRRSGGGMLSSDLIKKGGIEAKEIENITENLRKAGLLSLEYVVICKKTSNQVNRVSSKDKIDKMKEIGVNCSCGNPISEERIEEIFVPTPMLQKMLDQSYWMTARLVHFLGRLNISRDRILLNLREGAEEIDSFVDLDGSLLMFELKDSEFSMGHAYPFSGRIGLYKPANAFIVSTKGVAPEVRDYFKRVKPVTEIMYVENLSDLENNLTEVISNVRVKKAKDLIFSFEPMANIQVPLNQFLFSRLGFGKK